MNDKEMLAEFEAQLMEYAKIHNIPREKLTSVFVKNGRFWGFSSTEVANNAWVTEDVPLHGSADDIMYRAFSEATRHIATEYELHHRIKGQDSRRVWFKMWIRLMREIKPEWGDRAREDVNEILQSAPFDDRPFRPSSAPFIREGIISPSDLYGLMIDPDMKNIRILDATWAISGTSSAEAQWQEKRIGDAGFFDIEAVKDRASPLPNMFPSAAQFETHMSHLGISNTDFVVLYGQNGMIMGPPRAWWMFYAFGHHNVCVLDGGLPAWERAGLPLKTAPPRVAVPGAFKARFRPELVSNMSRVLEACQQSSATILDARSRGRFAGTDPEPRSGLHCGHIPGSRNVPATALVDSGGMMLSVDALEDRIGPVTLDKPIIVTSGSGVSACILALALYRIQRADVAVYNGSWREWGIVSHGMPVEKGASADS